MGYSHRGGGRQPIPIRDRALPKREPRLDERCASTPVPANALPGERDVVELGDVVRRPREAGLLPIFRHNGRSAEMVTAELAGRSRRRSTACWRSPTRIDAHDWGDLPKP